MFNPYQVLQKLLTCSISINRGSNYRHIQTISYVAEI